ncbi:hypothetical protein CI109_103961 [Kwoniella shandongensis]|uniref:Phosducin domain-containing protein n=1 Tax=Kwoniella shandongensis TaxID=1734106 RepID=A0A5M6C1Y7_9TREE|nr:uncharacterized protein CI109_004154 [Kwoniella shandongensis]KAA5527615.1 hypothetical protein CI109_004154 [Kwoniella shandongensis]
MSAPPSPTLSDSALLDSLEEAGYDLATDRERRLEALQAEVRKVQSLRETEYGRVVTYGEEKSLIERMSKEKYCIIHFFHPGFARCRIMDDRLSDLAPQHPHTLFLRAAVESVPFLVTKMGVQVLPCVLCFVDGKAVDRLIGFEELGDSDHFTVKMLEFRLKQTGVLPSGTLSLANHISSSLLTNTKQESDSDRSDSDEDDTDRRRRQNARAGAGQRKGKVGIRNGLAGRGKDEDEEW